MSTVVTSQEKRASGYRLFVNHPQSDGWQHSEMFELTSELTFFQILV